MKMNRLLSALLPIVWFPSLHAQEIQDENVAPIPIQPTAADQASIIGTLFDGKPVETKPVPVPRLVYDPADVQSSRTEQLGERLVTFEKIAPIELPPIPEPEEKSALRTTDAVNAFRARFGQQKPVKFLSVGATVYQAGEADPNPRSLVTIWSTPRQEKVSVWINANMLWLTGFANFETAEAKYSFVMMASAVNTAKMTEFYSRAGKTFTPPTFPNFGDESTASLVVVEGNPTEEELAPLRSLAALYTSDKERLKLAYRSRVAFAEEQARKLKENPPQKKNLVMKYWRVDSAGQDGEIAKPAITR